jgi:hypothetical protein
MSKGYVKKLLAIVVGVILGVLLDPIAMSGMPVFAAENPAQGLTGVWRLTSYAREEADTGKKVDLYGQHPSGYYSFSANGHFMGVLVGDNRKPQAGDAITDEERAALFKSIISAYSGRYTIEGDKLVIAVDVSWNQRWTGTKQSRQFKLAGKQLRVWNPPRKDMNSGRLVTSTLTFEKVE